jgi:serine/threonine-protein kinase HipA
MKVTHPNPVNVFLPLNQKKILVGTLAYKNRRIYFEYSEEFLKTGWELSPYKLPLKSGLHESKDNTFEGLFGLFNDSLPDGWGRLLIDRKLASLGINPIDLTPLDRLSLIGDQGMGALEYYPITTPEIEAHVKGMEELAEEALIYQQKEESLYLDDLLLANGSSAGARPKALLNIDQEEWIIKFRSIIDPTDIGLIEWAYHLMAKQGGLRLPKGNLFPSRKGGGFFGTRRFDRKDNHKIHMHTLSGLLHADHRCPSLDYDSILQATKWLTKNPHETEVQFRAIAFNILSHNRDDHSKNFSFLMDEKGSWTVSPAYDLTYSSGPAGEHCTMILGEGKNPTKNHLLALAKKHEIHSKTAKNIIDEVQEAVCSWKTIAKNAGVTPSSLAMIEKTLSKN